MSASTVTKSNACTKPMTIRCVRLSDCVSRSRSTRLMGPPPVANLRARTPILSFQKEPERATAPPDVSARCVNAVELRASLRHQVEIAVTLPRECCAADHILGEEQAYGVSIAVRLF